MEGKRFRCAVCDKCFVKSTMLLRHQLIHTGEEPFRHDVCDKSVLQLSNLHRHKHLHTKEKPFPCKVKLAHNTQECSLTEGQVSYIKELEEFTKKLFGLSSPTITNGGSDMGMSEDTQVSMVTSDGDGGELAIVSEIPERTNEEGTEVKTSQQCGMAAAVEEVEECQEGKMSELEASVDELKLVCMKEEACDALVSVVEGGSSEPSGGEHPTALGAEAPPSARAYGQHQDHTAGEENKDDLKPFACLHREQVQSMQATSNLLQQTLIEFKKDVSKNLQRNNEILQHHLQRNNEILQQHLQINNEILQQQNNVLCQLFQRSNEALNEMRQILSQIVAPSGQQQSSAETSVAGHASDPAEVTSREWGRH